MGICTSVVAPITNAREHTGGIGLSIIMAKTAVNIYITTKDAPLIQGSTRLVELVGAQVTGS